MESKKFAINAEFRNQFIECNNAIEGVVKFAEQSCMDDIRLKAIKAMDTIAEAIEMYNLLCEAGDEILSMYEIANVIYF